MDKKDLYEHLAKIYLDASQKQKARKKNKNNFDFKNLFFALLIAAVGISFFSFGNFNKRRALNSNFALVIQPDSAKINFNFDPARKEIYSINLNRLNASRFKTLGFSVKKANYRDKVSLRVEFTNAFKEKSEVYLKNISHKWQEYKLPLADFKNIGDWSEMLALSFVIEEWNTTENNGVVYIDNVALLH